MEASLSSHLKPSPWSCHASYTISSRSLLRGKGAWGWRCPPSPSGAEFNPLTPNDLYISRTAPLTSKRCILYFYSTNVSTEYFKHVLYSPFFCLQNAVCFIMLTCLVPVLFTFYIQGVPKLKKNNSGAKGLKKEYKCTSIRRRKFLARSKVNFTFFFLQSYFPSEKVSPTCKLLFSS